MQKQTSVCIFFCELQVCYFHPCIVNGLFAITAYLFILVIYTLPDTLPFYHDEAGLVAGTTQELSPLVAIVSLFRSTQELSPLVAIVFLFLFA